MKYEIIKICTGEVKTITLGNGKMKKTGLIKTPIKDKTMLTKLGLIGDEHEYSGHGGVNKAICLYDKNDYALWSDYIPNMPEYAMFGENITTIGLTKDEIAIGDTFKFGEAVIQVTEARGPCNTIAGQYNVPELVKMMSAAHATGCYFRVVVEGYVYPDSQLEMIEKDPLQFTINEFNALLYSDKKNVQLLNKAATHPALPDEYKDKFKKRLEKLT